MLPVRCDTISLYKYHPCEHYYSIAHTSHVIACLRERERERAIILQHLYLTNCVGAHASVSVSLQAVFGTHLSSIQPLTYLHYDGLTFTTIIDNQCL